MIETEAARVRRSASQATAPEELEHLAWDPSVTVRASLAINPATPDTANAVLARDPDLRVRELLARKLGSLLPTLSDTDRDAVRARNIALLTQLAADEAERVRAAIASEIRDLPDVPADLVLGLANDPVITVSEPVILFSPLLTAVDLVALVTSAPSPDTRDAVARRPDLPETVSDAIAASADDRAIRSLLSNQSAHIREATLDALVARAAEHETWQEPLAHRPRLSARAMRMLTEIVAGHLLEVLSTRVDLPDQVRERLRERLIATTPQPVPTGGVEEQLMAAEASGDGARAIRVLARAAEVSEALVEQAVALRSIKGLVALTWKAGLPMRVSVGLQRLLTHASPGGLMHPAPDGGYPLTSEEMNWQLTFLAGAAHSGSAAGQAWFSGGSGSHARIR